MATKQPPTVFLVRRSPAKLTPYERHAIQSHFGSANPKLIRIEMTDWKSHVDFCEKHVDPERDIVFLPRTADDEAVKATALRAVYEGFVHAFFGKDLELRKLTGVKIESKPL